MRILDKIRSSLHYKVLIAFLLIGIVPYLLIILYFSYLGRQSMINHKLEIYNQQINQTKLLMQSRLLHLQDEILFLSKLEIFNDMISADIDKRISRLLEQKSKTFKDESIILLALDLNNKVIASSHLNISKEKNLIKFDKTKPKGIKVVDKNLLFFTELKASFDNRRLGYLVALYPLKNLKSYIIHSQGVDFIIKNDQNILLSSNHLKTNSYTTISSNLKEPLKEYKIIYIIANKQIDDFINRFIFYLGLLILVGTALIIIVSKKLTTNILNPILTLTDTAKKIVKTKRYDLFVKSHTIDETNQLAKAFNQLIKTTSKTLQELDLENSIRMQRFIDLTDMFNHITQIQDKNSCINISIEKLKLIVEYDLSFKPLKSDISKEQIALAIQTSSSKNQKSKIFGYLIIHKNKFENPLESRFFHSVVSMIALQIEKIDLITKIKSASNAKTSFISNMSHEFRTPLNAIIGFSQYLMMYEELNQDQIQTVAKIEKSAIHLLSMINDILDIAKIEAGKMDINYSKVDLFELLHECKELLSSMSSEKNLYIKGLEDKSKTLWIKSDPKLIKQVIINLLSNAIKFTQKGGITIHVNVDQNFAIVTISDTGIGIKKEELNKVFEEFVQLQNIDQTKHKGTGLGLSLSLNIIKALGGELSLENNPNGVGTKAILKIKIN